MELWVRVVEVLFLLLCTDTGAVTTANSALGWYNLSVYARQCDPESMIGLRVATRWLPRIGATLTFNSHRLSASI